jgi:hypothetical protein
MINEHGGFILKKYEWIRIEKLKDWITTKKSIGHPKQPPSWKFKTTNGRYTFGETIKDWMDIKTFAWNLEHAPCPSSPSHVNSIDTNQLLKVYK